MGNDEEIIDLSCGFDDDDYVFEQAKNGFIFWSKKEGKQVENPMEYANYKSLPDCAWKLASKIEDYGDQEKLWGEVKNFITDHVFLPDERLYDVLTAWVIANWVPEKWNVIPYLTVKGPVNSGKTRLLETLEAISYRGIFSANMTSSALFRLCELCHPSIFLDETEIYTHEAYSDVLHLVNAGYRRGQKAWRVEHSKDGLMFVKGYDVFGFKAFSGTKELTAAVHSRSIVIDMVRNPRSVNFSINEKKALLLRNKLLKWRFEQLSNESHNSGDESDESDDSTEVYPPMLEELAKLGDGRLMELFYSLLSISNAGTKSILDFAKTMFTNRQNEEQTTMEFQILEALLKCQDSVNNGRLLAKKVTETLNEGLETNERFTTNYVTRILSELGFKKVHLKKGVGVIWDKVMIEYRTKQYRIEEDTPLKSSKSSISSPLLSEVQPKEEKAIVSLVRLTTHFEDKCFKCGFQGTMDYQANFTDGTWGLLCEICGRELEKQLGG